MGNYTRNNKENKTKHEPEVLSLGRTEVYLTISVYPFNSESNVLAMVNIDINEMFAINSIRLVKGSKGPFLSFPQYRKSDGEYKDIVFPLDADLRRDLTDTVVGMYQNIIDGRS